MIYVICEACQHGLRVSPGEHGEAEALFGHGEVFECWECGRATETLVSADSLFASVGNITDVSPTEAFAALHGLGLPQERDCTALAVADLLTTKRVVEVSVKQIRNSHRCVIGRLELEDGTRVYLGSSAYGATVYRVASRHSYVESDSV